MGRRVKSGILAVLATVALIVGATGVPAQAAAVHGCPDDTVCLYQGINYWAPVGDTNPGWKSSFLNLYNSPNGCINLTSPMAYWPNGTQVADNSGSWVVNNASWPGNYFVTFFDWVNCNEAGGQASAALNPGDWLEPDLRDVGFTLTLRAYHRVTSVRLKYGPFPPSVARSK